MHGSGKKCSGHGKSPAAWTYDGITKDADTPVNTHFIFIHNAIYIVREKPQDIRETIPYEVVMAERKNDF